MTFDQKAYKKQWNIDNRERRSLLARQNYIKNFAKVQAYARQYRRDHPEAHNKAAKKYRENNRRKVAAQSAASRKRNEITVLLKANAKRGKVKIGNIIGARVYLTVDELKQVEALGRHDGLLDSEGVQQATLRKLILIGLAMETKTNKKAKKTK